MAHEIAKLLLEHAKTFLDRSDAVRAAMRLGMPLNEIQEYLDWLDSIEARPGSRNGKGRSKGSSPDP